MEFRWHDGVEFRQLRWSRKHIISALPFTSEDVEDAKATFLR